MIRETDAPDPYSWDYAANEYEKQFLDNEEETDGEPEEMDRA